MEDKIAVYCRTKKEFDRVRGSKCCAWETMIRNYPFYEKNGVYVSTYDDGNFCHKEWFVGLGYTITTAAEYLGGKDVKQFEIGDRVEVVAIMGASGIIGEQGVVEKISEGISGDMVFVVKLDGGDKTGFYADRIKSTKPKTTKENNMNINSSIRTVLVDENDATVKTVERFQEVFGSEIAENFTGAMILRKNIATYNDEIKRLDDIEAKRLKEEAKKK